MLEWLVLRPELCAFERALTDRIATVASLEDERFARPRGIEKDSHDRLVIVSEYVPGRRLADVLDAAADHGIVAGLDAGLGLLLELLPALARLHDAGLAHGSLAPGRVMITPAGQLVLLDAIFAESLERLQLTRRRLWSEFRLAFPPTAGFARFDKAADLSHAAMAAASLSIGRPLRDDDYPDGIPALRQEILEIASIRGSKSFAEAVDKFFVGVLPVAGRRATTSADEAAIDLRKLVRKELGINTCRTALLEFFQQVEAAEAERIAAETEEQEKRAAAEAEEQEKRAAAEAERLAVEQARLEAKRVEGERIDAERRERERLEAERLERERAEKARLEAQRIERERLEAERVERERAENARLEAEKARLEAERLERERLEAERLERERLEAEQRERERLEAERREQERLEAERLERERAEKARLEAERLERERLEAERREQERLEAERLERERLEAERRERERLEAERLERERAEKARLEAERLERERLEAERREQERLEAERLERERAEKARLEAERLERERAEKARLEVERLERERAEKARLEAERLERERLEAERREQERLEAERLKRERAEKARLEAERLERERLEAEKARLEAERLERERVEAERRERERLEAERLDRERAEKARLERERAEKARLEGERLDREREDAERREGELLEAAKVERERAVKARQEHDRLEKERLEAERAEAARIEKERLEGERAERERIEARRKAERAEAERIEKERRDAERAEREKVEARREAERAERERAEKERRDAERAEHQREQKRRAEREREEKARREEERLEKEAEKAAKDAAWLIPPDRAAAFEPAVPVEPPSAPVARAYPVYHPPAESTSWTPSVPVAEAPEIVPVAASTPAPPRLTIVPAPVSTGPAPIRVKDDAKQPIRLKGDADHAHGGSGSGRTESRHEPVDLSASEAYEPFRTGEPGRSIPWKMIAAGVVLVAGTIGVTRYRPSTAPIIATVKKVVPAPAAPAAPTVPSNVGRLTITTEPAGARILMDGKAAGESPLTLEAVTPGRHVVTFVGTGGSLKRTIKVEGGRSLALDVPLFSGFAAIAAPFVIEVSEGGKALGTSDDQIILWPGHHELHLANKALGYSATEAVDIQAGEVTRVTLDPKGTANINAAPWAEVWIDGDKAGETPLANVAIGLGSREIVFKNPQFGERKVTATIKAGAPITISVDFAKDR